MMGFGSPANGSVNYEQKCREQADQLQKMQQIAQTLKSENNTLKAPGGVAAELAKRDDTIQRLKQEAKAVIDKLKQKHAEELRNLQNENAVVLANAGSSNIGGDAVTNAHLAELNADLDSCRQKIADLEVNAEFTEADKAEACARADALQQQLATKDAELAGLSAQLQTLQAAGSSGAAEEELKTAQAAVTRLEGEKARAEAAAASAAQQILQLQEALEEARKVRAHGEQALADAKVEVEQGRAEAQALQAKAATLEAQLQQTQQELQQVKAAFDENVPSGASGPSEVDDERPVEKANELRSDSEEALGKAQDAVAAAQAEMAAAVAEKAQAEAALEVAQQAAAAAAAEKVSVEEALQKAEQAAAAQNEEMQVQLQQLQRDLQAAAAREGGIDAGGGSAEEVQALKNELQEASAARVAAEQQKQECEKTLKDELGKAKLDLQQARTDARELKNAKEAVETDLQDKNSKVEELNKRVETIKKEGKKTSEKIMKQLEDAQEENSRLTEQLQQCQQREDQEDPIQQLLDEVQTKTVEVQQAQQEQVALQQALQEAANAKQEAIDEGKSQIAQLQASLEQSQGDKQEQAIKLHEAQETRKADAAKLETLQQQVTKLTLNEEEWKKKYGDLKDMSRRAMEEHIADTTKISALKKELAECQERVAALQQQHSAETHRLHAEHLQKQEQLQLELQAATRRGEEGGVEQTRERERELELAQVLERADSLEVQLRASKEEAEQLQQEIQGLRQSLGEEAAHRDDAGASVGNREAQEVAPLGNGAGAGEDDEWSEWNGGDSAAARDSSFANPQPTSSSAQAQDRGGAGGEGLFPPSSPAAAGPLSAQGAVADAMQPLPGIGAVQDWNEGMQGDISHLSAQFQAIQLLAARCADGGGSSTDLASLLAHVEHLRPSLFNQWSCPAGETIQVGSWEELCMWLFAHSASSMGDATASPMVFCGLANRPLLTTAQRAGETSQHSELAISQEFQRAARGLLPSYSTQVEWMALGQRHGLPTRMIDFSASPFAAVHAALLASGSRENGSVGAGGRVEEEDAVVWCVDAVACNKSCNYYAEWVQDVQWFRRRRPGRRQAPPGERDKALTPEDVEDLVEYCQSRSERQEAREANVDLMGGGAGGGGADEQGRDESAGSNPADALNLQVLGDVVLFMEAPNHAHARSLSMGMEDATYGAATGGAALGAQGHVVAVMANAYQRMEDWLSRRPTLYRRIVIPARLKAQVRAHLDQAGFTERTLDRGLDGLCAWIKRRYK